jgi:hypothetical protein
MQKSSIDPVFLDFSPEPETDYLTTHKQESTTIDRDALGVLIPEAHTSQQNILFKSRIIWKQVPEASAETISSASLTTKANALIINL